MKSIITGMGGFIGTNLFDKLRHMGHDVYGIMREELSNKDLLHDKFERIQPDYIFHLATYGNHSYQTDETETIATNILKTYQLLHASQNVQYKAFFNFSSSSVTLSHETFYSATKTASEHICKAFALKYNKNIYTIRPASVFGENEAPYRFIPRMVECIQTKEEFMLDPNPTHSWIYIKDFVEAIAHLINVQDKLTTGESINISYGKKWTNLEIATMVEDLSQKILYTNMKSNMRAYDTDNWFVDNSRITELGWSPIFGLSQGLLNTYKWYIDHGGKKQ